MPSTSKTELLKLNQWQSNEYPKMDDFNSDNLKIDNKFKELSDEQVGNYNKIGDLTTLTTIDKSSLVNAIKENTASLSQNTQDINNLKTNKVNKDGTLQTNLNADLLDGKNATDFFPMFNTMTGISGLNLDTDVKNGFQHAWNATGTLPVGWTTDNDIYVLSTWDGNSNWQRQVIFDIRSNNIFQRAKMGGTWSVWKQIATTEIFAVSSQNQWYGAWSTNSTNIFACEKNGSTTHVYGLLVAGISTTDTIVAQFPSIGVDMWIYVLCEDGSVGSFYLGWDGKLYAKYNVKQGKNYCFNFSYRNS